MPYLKKATVRAATKYVVGQLIVASLFTALRNSWNVDVATQPEDTPVKFWSETG